MYVCIFKAVTGIFFGGGGCHVELERIGAKIEEGKVSGGGVPLPIKFLHN